VFLAPRGDGHTRPFGGQLLGGALPSPSTASGDDGHLALQTEIEHGEILLGC